MLENGELEKVTDNEDVNDKDIEYADFLGEDVPREIWRQQKLQLGKFLYGSLGTYSVESISEMLKDVSFKSLKLNRDIFTFSKRIREYIISATTTPTGYYDQTNKDSRDRWINNTMKCEVGIHLLLFKKSSNST